MKERVRKKIEQLHEELVNRRMLNPFADITDKYGDGEVFELHARNAPTLKEVLDKYGFYIIGVGYGADPHSFGSFTQPLIRISPEKFGETHPNF